MIKTFLGAYPHEWVLVSVASIYLALIKFNPFVFAYTLGSLLLVRLWVIDKLKG